MAEERMLNDEILLGLIKANSGGGGGTSDYSQLSNKPQINSVTLSGNKSASDLGLATTTDLAGKQDALTAGDYIVIKNDKISVSKLKQGELDLYSYEFVSTDTSHTPKVKVVKKVNGETISETVYDEFQAANWMTFDDIIRFRYDASDSYKWKYQCLVTSNEHVKDTVVSWYWNQAVDYTETFDVGASAITDLVTKGDMTDALATKQDTLTFDNTPTQNSTNPVKSGGVYSVLVEKADTDIVASDFDATASYTAGNYCIYEGKFYKFKASHSGAWSAADVDEIKIAGELNELKSGLTTLDNEVNGDSTVYPYADVITIEDAIPANLADCNVKIEPVQDLHGQSAPYVGGAGKNKLPMTVDSIKAANNTGTWTGNVYALNDLTFEILTDESEVNVHGIKVNGTASANALLILANNIDLEEYSGKLLNGCPSGGGSGIFGIGIAQTNSPYKGTSTYGDDQTIRNDWEGVTNGYAYIQVFASNTVSNVTFLPMIRLATEQDATFAPYTNICPISGHTEASVQRVGKNLIGILGLWKDDGEFDSTIQGLSTAMIPVAAGQKITCSKTTALTTSSGHIYVLAFNESKALINRTELQRNYVTGSVTYTVPSGVNYVAFTVYMNADDWADKYSFELQVELGSTATPYVPYAGKTYTIALGSTIYGGTVDFDSGVMTVTHGIADLGDLDWVSASGNQFTSDSLTDIKVPETSFTDVDLLCSSYIVDSRNYTNLNTPHVRGVYTNGRLYFVTDEYSTPSDFKASVDGVQLCYELATPTTIQLTPTQIQLLKGQNTLTASTGQISVTVNGVSGSIGQVQEQVNELAEDVADVQSGLAKLHYHKVAESAATGTRADKLASLYTKYNTLPNDVRKSAILVRSNADILHAVNNGGAFSSVYLDANSLVIIGISLNPGSFVVNSNGTTTDGSSTENAEVYSLWIIE